MKRIFLLIISILICASVQAEELGTVASVDIADNFTQNHKIIIEDELVKSDAFPKILPTYIKENAPIVDEFIIPYQQSGTTLKIWARKNSEKHQQSIDDELINQKFVSKVGTISILKKQNKKIIEDNFIKNNPNNRKIGRLNIKNTYDFSKSQIPVQMKIIKNLTTKNGLEEGDALLFKTVKEVCIKGTTLPKGTQVIGRVETVSESDKMGTPANIVIDNFYVKDKPEICFYGNISKTGANRSIWVYPLYQAGNLIFYVAGFAFVPIHGGHAKLLTNDTYTVFYETR